MLNIVAGQLFTFLAVALDLGRAVDFDLTRKALDHNWLYEDDTFDFAGCSTMLLPATMLCPFNGTDARYRGLEDDDQRQGQRVRRAFPPLLHHDTKLSPTARDVRQTRSYKSSCMDHDNVRPHDCYSAFLAWLSRAIPNPL